MANHRLKALHHVGLFHHEIAAIEERGYRPTDQQRTYNTVDDQAHLESRGTQEISQFVLKLIAHGLNNKGKQDKHPHPVGSAKTGTVKQREGGKERTTKRYQRGKRKFPFPAGGVDDQTAFFGGLAQFKNQRVGPLNKKEKYEECGQQRYHKPPI